YIEANDCTMTGWEKRPTKKPTAFMMTTKFISMLVITMGRNRQLARPLKDYQLQYLEAMGVTADIFTVP
ncbi:MAG: transposase, partial [Desulfobacteraceae bacterium]|nr:transposase [Desulfobacteraceae bacterium]